MIGSVSASFGGMDACSTPIDDAAIKTIRVGLTCWLWELGRSKAIVELGKRMGVTVQLTQKVRGLYRDIDAEVSGQNVDRFLSEFVRHC